MHAVFWSHNLGHEVTVFSMLWRMSYSSLSLDQLPVWWNISESFFNVKFFCLCHSLCHIFILLVTTTSLFYVDKFAFLSPSGLNDSSDNIPTISIPSLIPLTFYLNFTSTVSIFHFLTSFSSFLAILSFNDLFLWNVLWVYHWETRGNTATYFVVCVWTNRC